MHSNTPHQANRILRDVSAQLRVVVSEYVVYELCLVVVVLSLDEEWDTDTVAVGGIPVIHLLDYLTIHIQPSMPNLFALGIVRFGTCFPPLGLLRPRTLSRFPLYNVKTKS